MPTADASRCRQSSGYASSSPTSMTMRRLSTATCTPQKFTRTTTTENSSSRCVSVPVRDNYNPTSHKYVCITTYQSDTKSNPNPNPNANPTTKQHAIVYIQLNYSHMSYLSRQIHTRHVVAPSVRLSVVIVI